MGGRFDHSGYRHGAMNDLFKSFNILIGHCESNIKDALSKISSVDDAALRSHAISVSDFALPLLMVDEGGRDDKGPRDGATGGTS